MESADETQGGDGDVEQEGNGDLGQGDGDARREGDGGRLGGGGDLPESSKVSLVTVVASVDVWVVV